jgi:hypothetical protein
MASIQRKTQIVYSFDQINSTIAKWKQNFYLVVIGCLLVWKTKYFVSLCRDRRLVYKQNIQAFFVHIFHFSCQLTLNVKILN